MALDPAKFQTMVKDVARSVSSSYPAYITAEDTEGHLWVWVYDKKTSLIKTVEDNPNEWEPMIASTMRKVAFDHCAKEKAATEGYSVDDLFRYSLPKIKTLLPDVFDYADWQSFGQQGDGQPKGRPQANQTGDRTVELIDIRSAVERLSEETKTLLWLQYSAQYSMENIAEALSLTLEAAKKRAQRALTAVQKELGQRDMAQVQGRHAGRRAVRSNAAWRAAQSNQYEGA